MASCSARPTKVGLDTRRTRPLSSPAAGATAASGKARPATQTQRRQPALAARLARGAPLALGRAAQLGLVEDG